MPRTRCRTAKMRPSKLARTTCSSAASKPQQATSKLAADNTQRATLQHKARSTTLQHAPGNVQHARHTTCKAHSMLHAGPSVATLIQQMMQKTVQHNMQANRQRMQTKYMMQRVPCNTQRARYAQRANNIAGLARRKHSDASDSKSESTSPPPSRPLPLPLRPPSRGHGALSSSVSVSESQRGLLPAL